MPARGAPPLALPPSLPLLPLHTPVDVAQDARQAGGELAQGGVDSGVDRGRLFRRRDRRPGWASHGRARRRRGRGRSDGLGLGDRVRHRRLDRRRLCGRRPLHGGQITEEVVIRHGGVKARPPAVVEGRPRRRRDSLRFPSTPARALRPRRGSPVGAPLRRAERAPQCARRALRRARARRCARRAAVLRARRHRPCVTGGQVGGGRETGAKEARRRRRPARCRRPAARPAARSAPPSRPPSRPRRSARARAAAIGGGG